MYLIDPIASLWATVSKSQQVLPIFSGPEKQDDKFKSDFAIAQPQCSLKEIAHYPK